MIRERCQVFIDPEYSMVIIFLISAAVNILVVAVRRVALSPLCCGRSVEARLLSTLGSDQDKTMKDTQITS